MNNNSGFNQDNRRINNTNNFYATPQPGGQQYFPTRNMLPNNLSISDINAMPTLLPHLQNMAAIQASHPLLMQQHSFVDQSNGYNRYPPPNHSTLSSDADILQLLRTNTVHNQFPSRSNYIASLPMNETPIPRENTYASINTLSQHLLNPTTSDPPLPNFYPANIDSISSGSRINPNSIQNTQMARSLKRQEAAQMSSPPPMLFTPNVTRLADAGCSTGIVQTPPSKIRRIMSGDARSSNMLEPQQEFNDPAITSPCFVQRAVPATQQLATVIPVPTLPMVTPVLPNVLIPRTSSLFATTQAQPLYPSFSPSGVELFVASAINAATATIPSIVAAAYNQQQCPVCVAAICQQPTASTVSACGNCIHHHHLHTVCHRHFTPMVYNQSAPSSSMIPSNPMQGQLSFADCIGSNTQIPRPSNSMNSVHSELLANRSLQGERNRASANNFYQQHHVNIMRHLVYNPQNSSQPAINDPTMMFFMPVSDTALFLNRNISETQVHATIIAAATAAAAAAGISEVQPVGISLSEIKKHSTKMNYVKNQETPEEEKERCIICLIDLENDDEIRILNCTHLFHVECIDKWLVYNKKCPVCRVDVDKTASQTSDVSIDQPATSLIG